jgi:hypothetical protein
MIAAAGIPALIHVSIDCVVSIPPSGVYRDPNAMRPYNASTPNETPTAPRAASFAYLRTEIVASMTVSESQVE